MIKLGKCCPALSRIALVTESCLAFAATEPSGGVETGVEAYYSRRLEGHRAASGATYNPNNLTAAHNSIPFGTQVKITNKRNGRTATAVVNDRGPTTPGRIVDVSRRVARQLGFLKSGLTEVELEVIH